MSSPDVKAQPVGAEYGLTVEKSISDIYELHMSAGLRVIVETNPRGSLERLWLEYYFPHPRGFRMLDESDMLRWWGNKVLQSGHHLYEITGGGWLAKEVDFDLTKLESPATKEWLIKTNNRSLSVVAQEAPLVRELLTR